MLAAAAQRQGNDVLEAGEVSLSSGTQEASLANTLKTSDETSVEQGPAGQGDVVASEPVDHGRQTDHSEL